MAADDAGAEDVRTGQDYAGLDAEVDALYAEYAIASEVRDGADFAGAYTLDMRGCGSACQFVTLIRLADGEELRGVTASEGMDWREDSRLVIANPPVDLMHYGETQLPDYLRPKCFVLTAEESFEQVDCGF
ncbi:hypothetical protein [Maricaulis sp.]|uniref:hypothetical protein n=1 Tax=Maricaulis sp. TaxID=1486257 RepID=UPI0026354F05|nr:hypothetical protein [Maricaulis sp.]